MGARSLSNLAGGIGVAEVKWGKGWGSSGGRGGGLSGYVRRETRRVGLSM